MKIEIKNIKHASNMSEETNAFTADIYVNGVKTGYAKNNGHGGCTDYNRYEGKMDLLKEAEQFCLTLPPLQYPANGSMKAFEFPMNLEHFIDNAIEEDLKKKHEAKVKKQFEKKQINSILWGVPNDTKYTQVSFRVPLDKIPALQLQTLIDKYKKELKEGQVFLNTNLEKLGVKI